VPIIDCGIPVAQDDAAYQEGIAAGVFIKDMSGKPYIGQVGAFKDWSIPDSVGSWHEVSVSRGR
jgi:alpha-glucosidase (family GH31 glycosyl hydrolase)